MWHENVEEFGQQIEPNSTFRFECGPELTCFGKCCSTEVTLTPYDIAGIRRHLRTDTDGFISEHCQTYIDSRTGFPFVMLRQKDDATCIFLGPHGCDVYENRPSCCRSYPLARIVDEDGKTGTRSVKYHLQKKADYCEGLGRGTEWTIAGYCDVNGLGPYDMANDLFLDVPFAFRDLPSATRQDREIQTMVFEAVFNFDRFFAKYGQTFNCVVPENDHDMIALVRNIALGLIEKIAGLKL